MFLWYVIRLLCIYVDRLHSYLIDDGKEMLIDINDKTKDEIYDHLVTVVGKTS